MLRPRRVQFPQAPAIEPAISLLRYATGPPHHVRDVFYLAPAALRVLRDHYQSPMRFVTNPPDSQWSEIGTSVYSVLTNAPPTDWGLASIGAAAEFTSAVSRLTPPPASPRLLSATFSPLPRPPANHALHRYPAAAIVRAAAAAVIAIRPPAPSPLPPHDAQNAVRALVSTLPASTDAVAQLTSAAKDHHAFQTAAQRLRGANDAPSPAPSALTLAAAAARVIEADTTWLQTQGVAPLDAGVAATIIAQIAVDAVAVADALVDALAVPLGPRPPSSAEQADSLDAPTSTHSTTAMPAPPQRAPRSSAVVASHALVSVARALSARCAVVDGAAGAAGAAAPLPMAVTPAVPAHSGAAGSVRAAARWRAAGGAFGDVAPAAAAAAVAADAAPGADANHADGSGDRGGDLPAADGAPGGAAGDGPSAVAPIDATGPDGCASAAAVCDALASGAVLAASVPPATAGSATGVRVARIRECRSLDAYVDGACDDSSAPTTIAPPPSLDVEAAPLLPPSTASDVTFAAAADAGRATGGAVAVQAPHPHPADRSARSPLSVSTHPSRTTAASAATGGALVATAGLPTAGGGGGPTTPPSARRALGAVVRALTAISNALVLHHAATRGRMIGSATVPGTSGTAHHMVPHPATRWYDPSVEWPGTPRGAAAPLVALLALASPLLWPVGSAPAYARALAPEAQAAHARAAAGAQTIRAVGRPPVHIPHGAAVAAHDTAAAATAAAAAVLGGLRGILNRAHGGAAAARVDPAVATATLAYGAVCGSVYLSLLLRRDVAAADALLPGGSARGDPLYRPSGGCDGNVADGDALLDRAQPVSASTDPYADADVALYGPTAARSSLAAVAPTTSATATVATVATAATLARVQLLRAARAALHHYMRVVFPSVVNAIVTIAGPMLLPPPAPVWAHPAPRALAALLDVSCADENAHGTRGAAAPLAAARHGGPLGVAQPSQLPADALASAAWGAADAPLPGAGGAGPSAAAIGRSGGRFDPAAYMQLYGGDAGSRASGGGSASSAAHAVLTGGPTGVAQLPSPLPHAAARGSAALPHTAHANVPAHTGTTTPTLTATSRASPFAPVTAGCPLVLSSVRIPNPAVPPPLLVAAAALVPPATVRDIVVDAIALQPRTRAAAAAAADAIVPGAFVCRRAAALSAALPRATVGVAGTEASTPVARSPRGARAGDSDARDTPAARDAAVAPASRAAARTAAVARAMDAAMVGAVAAAVAAAECAGIARALRAAAPAVADDVARALATVDIASRVPHAHAAIWRAVYARAAGGSLSHPAAPRPLAACLAALPHGGAAHAAPLRDVIHALARRVADVRTVAAAIAAASGGAGSGGVADVVIGDAVAHPQVAALAAYGDLVALADATEAVGVGAAVVGGGAVVAGGRDAVDGDSTATARDDEAPRHTPAVAAQYSGGGVNATGPGALVVRLQTVSAQHIPTVTIEVDGRVVALRASGVDPTDVVICGAAVTANAVLGNVPTVHFMPPHVKIAPAISAETAAARLRSAVTSAVRTYAATKGRSETTTLASLRSRKAAFTPRHVVVPAPPSALPVIGHAAVVDSTIAPSIVATRRVIDEPVAPVRVVVGYRPAS